MSLSELSQGFIVRLCSLIPCWKMQYYVIKLFKPRYLLLPSLEELKKTRQGIFRGVEALITDEQTSRAAEHFHYISSNWEMKYSVLQTFLLYENNTPEHVDSSHDRCNRSITSNTTMKKKVMSNSLILSLFPWLHVRLWIFRLYLILKVFLEFLRTAAAMTYTNP